MAITFEDLKNIVRQRLNIERSTNIRDNDIYFELNNSLKENYEKILNSGEVWNLKEYELIVNNLNLNEGEILPEDFYKLFRVDKWIDKSSNSFISLERINIRNEQEYGSPYYNNASILTIPSQTYNYSMVQMSDGYTYLKLYPPQNKAGTYRIMYFPEYPDIDNPTDIVQLGQKGQNWWELAVLDVCIKIKINMEEDPSAFMSQKQNMLIRLKDSATARDQQYPLPPPKLFRGWYNKQRKMY